VFDAAELELFIEEGASWAAARNALLHREGRPLAPEVVARLSSFFPAETLARIRVVPVPAIPNPDFYRALRDQGARIPLDFTVMSALTLVDTVLVSTKRADFGAERFERLLFHEAVHVMQYEVLGLSRFMREYVVGWATAGFSYEKIPIEVQAYALERRFAEGAAPFSVEGEIARLFGQ
jgi:hypothetical protein